MTARNVKCWERIKIIWLRFDQSIVLCKKDVLKRNCLVFRERMVVSTNYYTIYLNLSSLTFIYNCLNFIFKNEFVHLFYFFISHFNRRHVKTCTTEKRRWQGHRWRTASNWPVQYARTYLAAPIQRLKVINWGIAHLVLYFMEFFYNYPPSLPKFSLSQVLLCFFSHSKFPLFSHADFFTRLFFTRSKIIRLEIENISYFQCLKGFRAKKRR